MATFQNRNGRWRAIIRKKGQTPLSQTFRTKGQAQRWAKGIEDAFASGQFSETQAWRRVTIGKALDAHVAHLERTEGRSPSTRSNVKTLKAGLGEDTLLTDLDYNTLLEFCLTRRNVDGVKRSTLLHNIMTLSGAVGTAVLELDVPGGFSKEVAGWRKGLLRAGVVAPPPQRDRRPTQEELDALLEHLEHNLAVRMPYAELIEFAADSAMRLGEICAIRRADYNAERGTVIIRARKHPTDKLDNDQEVPLMGRAQAILEARPVSSDGRFFPYKVKSVSNGFRRLCEFLEIEDLHFHDLRHEGISRLFEQGHQIQEVAMVSGHRDWKSLQRYVNLKPGDLVAKDRLRRSAGED